MWCYEKKMACLKLIVHPELLRELSDDVLQYHNIFDSEKPDLFVGNICRTMRGKFEIYGTVEEMIENFEKIDKIPELIDFVSSTDLKPPFDCVLTAPFSTYYDSLDECCYLSRRDCLMKMYVHWAKRLLSAKIDNRVLRFYDCWLIAFVGNILEQFKGSYELIPKHSYKPILSELKNIDKSQVTMTIPSDDISYESFLNLEKYFEVEQQFDVHNYLEESYIEKDKIAGNPEIYKKIYAEIVFMIEETKTIFERHVEFFTPFSTFSELTQVQSKYQTPVIRRLQGTNLDFFFAKEVETALNFVLNTRFPGTQLPADLIPLEEENERKFGMVYGITPKGFDEILEKLGISSDLFIILQAPIAEDRQNVPFPIISSYGTHCIPATTAFDKIIHYLTVILKVFQRSSPENREQIFDWIDRMTNIMFVEKPAFYLIEMRTIGWIIDDARGTLNGFLTEPVCNIVPQATYTRDEVFRELKTLTRNFGHFNGIADRLIDFCSDKPMTIKNIYDSCTQIVRACLLLFDEEANKFYTRQMMFEKKQEGSSNERLSNLNEYIIEVKNAEKAREEIEKLRVDKNKLEAEIHKLRDEMEEQEQKHLEKVEENKLLMAENSKFAEIQQKIEKHRIDLEAKHSELVDCAWSSIKRLSENVKIAKNDVRKLEECLDEYVENVEIEYEQLRQ